MIVVDTNVLYALADRDDAYHDRCQEWLAGVDDLLIVLPTVIAETCYLIDKYLGPAAEADFLEDIGLGPAYPFQLTGLMDSDLRRMAELVRRYADRRLGGTDASVIAVCERLSVTMVATVDHRDFANVQPRHVAAFTIVP